MVVDLGGCAAGAAGRLLDFASGLCCALDAGLHDVVAAVVLLAPPGVELAGAAARGGRLFNRLKSQSCASDDPPSGAAEGAAPGRW